MSPRQCSPTGPLWGDSESVSPALPWASGAFHHPSIYSLFKSGAPGHVAGREGRAPGWESRFCDLPREGLGFSRSTPLVRCPPSSSVHRRDGAPTPGAASSHARGWSLVSPALPWALEPGLCSSPNPNPGPDPASVTESLRADLSNKRGSSGMSLCWGGAWEAQAYSGEGPKRARGQELAVTLGRHEALSSDTQFPSCLPGRCRPRIMAMGNIHHPEHGAGREGPCSPSVTVTSLHPAEPLWGSTTPPGQCHSNSRWILGLQAFLNPPPQITAFPPSSPQRPSPPPFLQNADKSECSPKMTWGS